MIKNNLPDNAGATGDAGSFPGSGRSRGGGNGNPFQYPCLGNPLDRGTWWAIIHGVAELDTTEQLSIFKRYRWAEDGGCSCFQLLMVAAITRCV